MTSPIWMKSTARQTALPLAYGDSPGSGEGEGAYACGSGKTRPHRSYAASSAATGVASAGAAVLTTPSGTSRERTRTAARALMAGIVTGPEPLEQGGSPSPSLRAMSAVAVVTDSTAYLPDGVAETSAVSVVPLHVVLG